MGGGKKAALSAATSRATTGQALEDQRAQELKDQLQGTRDKAVQNSTAAGNRLTKAIGTNLKTGGFDPNAVTNITNNLDTAGAIGRDLSGTKPITGEDITNASYGRGREGYQQLADTGGFTPEQSNAFVRSSTRAAGANYAANQDELNRRLSLQGGYMPGFTSSAAALTRQGANAASTAATDAQVQLAQQVRSGKLAGLGGLESTREAAGREAQTAQNAVIQAKTAGGNLITNAAGQQIDLTGKVAAGKESAAKDLLEYYQSNVNQVSDSDKLNIANRLAQLGMTKADIDAFLGSASQQASGLQTVGSVIGDVATVGGAAAGLGLGGKH